jgi:coatomer protein complex subunit alpha (xenin)
VESSVRVKSAAFDELRDILYFTTSNHLKYCNLRNGECSTIRTLESPIYLVRAKGDNLWHITRDAKVVSQVIDNQELNFKLALQQEHFRDIIKIIQSKRLHGQALVAYLHKHGHSEIAMHFVSDPDIRFNLAVECGAMDIAKTTAIELNKPEVWRRLSDSAVKFGDIQLAQFASNKIHNYHSLGLQCLITGNLAALGHVIDKSNDDSFRLHYGLFTGDVDRRIQLLKAAGQLPLAYAVAVSNGRDELTQPLLEQMDAETAARCKSLSIQPAIPLSHVDAIPDNWPLLPVQESVFTRMLKEPGLLDIAPTDDHDPSKGAVWGEDNDDIFGDAAENNLASDFGEPNEVPETAHGGGDWDDDLEVEPTAQKSNDGPGKGAFVVPREGEAIPKHWADSCQIAAYHVAAGSFGTALEILKRQIGLRNPKPLQPYFMYVWASANASMPTWSAVPSHPYHITAAPPAGEINAKHSPSIPNMIPQLLTKVKAGYAAVTEGRFVPAHQTFLSVLHQIALAVVQDKKQLSELLEILAVAREYVSALNVELTRKDTQDPATMVELAAYFTHFKLQTQHLVLALSQAMIQAFKTKNFKTASNLARRLLDLDPPQERAEKARKVIQQCGQDPSNALSLNYNDRNPFTLCCVSRKPMYRGTVDPIRCTYCYATAHPDYKGHSCPVCDIAVLGGQAAGMISGAFQL